jgi:four helix bundle protein
VRRHKFCSSSGAMTIAYRYQDLICWQLANELEQLVFEVTATGPASKDFKFRDQIRDSSSSTTRNMAEGFGRFWPSEFSGFLTIARGSLVETRNSAGAGLQKRYFSGADTERMQRLALRSSKATTRLIKYLDSLPRGRRRGWAK